MQHGDSPRCVAARADFASVVIVDPHAEICAVAALQQDQLVASDTGMPVGDTANDALFQIGQGVFARIEHDEIIA